MLFRTLFRGVPRRSATCRRSSRPARRAGRSCPLGLEALEDRCLLSYSIIDIGTFGGNSSSGWAVDPHFNYRAAGYAALPGGINHAFWYEGGPKIDLGTLGGSESFGYGVDGGQVVGSSNLPGNQTSHAFLWSFSGGQTMSDLGTLGGSNSSARGVNDPSQVVGYSDTASRSQHAFLWTSTAGMTDLGTLGGMNSSARAINSPSPNQVFGQVVGASNPTGSQNSHAFLWTSTAGMKDLGTLGGANSYGEGINASSQVVGYSNPTGSFSSHAFLWTSTAGMKDLGTLGGANSYAEGINVNGLVVGDSYTRSNALHAFLYNGTMMQDLNSLIPPGSGWILTVANGINDGGQIVGTGIINGQNHAFLLTPNPSGGSPSGVRLSHGPGSGPALMAALLGTGPSSPATTWIVAQTPNAPAAAAALRSAPGGGLAVVGDPLPPANLGGGASQGPSPTATARPAPGSVDLFFADLGQSLHPLDGAPLWAA